MPYADPEMQRRYQREWMRERRRSTLSNARCALCESTDTADLELDHVPPLSVCPRPYRHRIFSLRPDRLAEELKHVRILCSACHRHESLRSGVGQPMAKLKPADVRAIREEFGSTPTKELADRFGVRPEAIRDAATGRTWKVVPDEELIASYQEQAA